MDIQGMAARESSFLMQQGGTSSGLSLFSELAIILACTLTFFCFGVMALRAIPGVKNQDFPLLNLLAPSSPSFDRSFPSFFLGTTSIYCSLRLLLSPLRPHGSGQPPRVPEEDEEAPRIKEPEEKAEEEGSQDEEGGEEDHPHQHSEKEDQDAPLIEPELPAIAAFAQEPAAVITPAPVEVDPEQEPESSSALLQQHQQPLTDPAKKPKSKKRGSRAKKTRSPCASSPSSPSSTPASLPSTSLPSTVSSASLSSSVSSSSATSSLSSALEPLATPSTTLEATSADDAADDPDADRSTVDSSGGSQPHGIDVIPAGSGPGQDKSNDVESREITSTDKQQTKAAEMVHTSATKVSLAAKTTSARRGAPVKPLSLKASTIGNATFIPTAASSATTAPSAAFEAPLTGGESSSPSPFTRSPFGYGLDISLSSLRGPSDPNAKVPMTSGSFFAVALF